MIKRDLAKMTEIAKIRRKRTAKKNAMNKSILVDLERLLNDDEVEENEKKIELSVRLETLRQATETIKQWDEKITDLVEDDEEAEKEEEESLEYQKKVGIAMKKVEDYLSRQPRGDMGRDGIHEGHRRNNSADRTSRYTSRENSPEDGERGSRMTGVKLPEIKIKKFNGDVTEWQSFIDSFDAAIGQKKRLTDVEKFTYLRGYVEGSALECIKGFPLTNENYDEALNLLKERYGNTQIIIATHMNQIINLEKVNTCNVKQLRQLYD